MIRYNEGPKKELELAPAPDNPAFPGPGDFIIDKNINALDDEPTSLLFPRKDE
jgi:hypothetical protein